MPFKMVKKSRAYGWIKQVSMKMHLVKVFHTVFSLSIFWNGATCIPCTLKLYAVSLKIDYYWNQVASKLKHLTVQSSDKVHVAHLEEMCFWHWMCYIIPRKETVSIFYLVKATDCKGHTYILSLWSGGSQMVCNFILECRSHNITSFRTPLRTLYRHNKNSVCNGEWSSRSIWDSILWMEQEKLSYSNEYIVLFIILVFHWNLRAWMKPREKVSESEGCVLP